MDAKELQDQISLLKQDLTTATDHESRLRKELEQTTAMAHTLFGRIQEAEHWLRKVLAPVPEST